MNISADITRPDGRVISAELAGKLAMLPDQPGVYIFKDVSERIIYIGKAKSLRARVRSYFNVGDDGRYQYPRLVASIRDLELILTTSEVEALKTEAGLIRHHKPRFNVDLRDDKSFPYIKITREPFPRVLLTRKPHEGPPGDIYGPYTDVFEVRTLLRTLKGALQIRDCALPLTPEKIAQGKFKLCLDYHIGRCGGPCEGKVDADDYAKGVKRLLQFLRGRNEETIAELEAEMRDFAVKLRFEDAAFARDRVIAARRFTEKQQKVTNNPIECDAIGMVREDSYAALAVIKVRRGRIVGQSPFHMDRAGGLDDSALLEAFLVRHYQLADSIPEEICLPALPADPTVLTEFLTGLAGRKVALVQPKRGERKHLLDIARTNAEHLLAERRMMSDKRDFVPRAVKVLQESLRLENPPLTIEAFDISHLSGVDTVASMVCFKDGKPYKAGYRIFKIKTVEGIDDFSSIGEAVQRRYSRLKRELAEANDLEQLESEAVAMIEEDEEGESSNGKAAMPDLILIDGGLGQLNRAKQVLSELELSSLPVIGLAKRLEEIYVPGEHEPLLLSKNSSALRLLQQVRDEAHRFAVTRQRLLRGKRQVKSKLDDIEGVGPTRRAELLKKFGSLRRIASATPEEIRSVKGISKRLAETIKGSLNG